MLALGATGVTMLLWCEFFATMNPTTVALVYSLAIVLGEVVTFFCGKMDRDVLWILLVVMPFFNIVWAVDSLHRTAGESDGSGAKPHMTFPIKPVVLMAAVSFADGYMSIYGSTSTVWTALGTLLVPCVVILVVISESNRFQLGNLYKLAMPAVVVGMILFMPMGEMGRSVGVMMFCGGDTALAIMTMIIFSNISYRYGVDPIWLNGIERGIRFSVLIAGTMLSTLVAPWVSDEVSFAIRVIIAIVTVVLFSVMFIPNSELFSQWGIRFIDDADGQQEDVAPARRSFVCEDLGREFKLTAREQEILLLLAQGKSTTQVEQELFIADGTMRAHMSHIYSKLDVHSHAELEGLLGKRGVRMQEGRA